MSNWGIEKMSKNKNEFTELREELDMLIDDEKNLNSDKILEKSQQLDKVIATYMEKNYGKTQK
jgi:hypothetical protein